jgi:hypothetical protein
LHFDGDSGVEFEQAASAFPRVEWKEEGESEELATDSLVEVSGLEFASGAHSNINISGETLV